MSKSQKGSAFEREIAHFLTKWLTGKEKPTVFWRTPLSGGMATINEENRELGSDIRPLTQEAEILTNVFSLELKTGYPKTLFHQHLKNIKNFEIENFWSQAYSAASKVNKHPMLIYRKKGMNISLGIESSIVQHFDLISERSIIMKFPAGYHLPSVEFFDFYSFFEKVGPEALKNFKG